MSNRHGRRKQAAEMRRTVSKATKTLGRQDEGYVVLGSRSAVPDDIKADVCRVVRAIQFTGLADGLCVWRTCIGYLTMRLLGWSPRICVGGMLYRVGTDPIRDTIAFCGPGNKGQLISGGFVGHVWLELDGELIDFSCGDWPQLDCRTELIDFGLPPVQWQRQPPTFVWATRGLFDWQPQGEPQVGELWYGPWTGERSNYIIDVLTRVNEFEEIVATNLVRMKLPDRVAMIEYSAM